MKQGPRDLFTLRRARMEIVGIVFSSPILLVCSFLALSSTNFMAFKTNLLSSLYQQGSPFSSSI